MITEMFTTKQQIKDFLKECKVFQKNYKIHKDLTVEILNGELDLSDTYTKIIPFKFIGVEKLIIHFAQIEYLENLPEGLERISAYNTPIKSTKGLPRSLKHLDISCTKIKIFEDLPEGLKELSASSTPLKSTKGVPNTVEYLDISHTEIEIFEDLPECLETLSAYDTPLKSTNGLPSTVKNLDIGRTPVKILNCIPRDCKVKY